MRFKRLSLYLSTVIFLCFKNLIFVKITRGKMCLFVCLFVRDHLYEVNVCFSFGLVFSCSWNESRCVDVFDIAVLLLLLLLLFISEGHF